MVLDGITLPDTLNWADEFDWSPISQSKSYSLTGALLIQESEKSAGRSITLAGSDELDYITRETVALLQTSRNTSDNEMTLVLPDLRSLTVRWDNSQTALEVEPLFPYNQYASGALYKIIAIRLFIV